jgi:hypothetical protein
LKATPLAPAARLGFGKRVTFLLLPLGFLKLLVQLMGFPTKGPIAEALGIDLAPNRLKLAGGFVRVSWVTVSG